MVESYKTDGIDKTIYWSRLFLVGIIADFSDHKKDDVCNNFL